MPLAVHLQQHTQRSPALWLLRRPCCAVLWIRWRWVVLVVALLLLTYGAWGRWQRYQFQQEKIRVLAQAQQMVAGIPHLPPSSPGRCAALVRLRQLMELLPQRVEEPLWKIGTDQRFHAHLDSGVIAELYHTLNALGNEPWTNDGHEEDRELLFRCTKFLWLCARFDSDAEPSALALQLAHMAQRFPPLYAYDVGGSYSTFGVWWYAHDGLHSLLPHEATLRASAQGEELAQALQQLSAQSNVRDDNLAWLRDQLACLERGRAMPLKAGLQEPMPFEQGTLEQQQWWLDYFKARMDMADFASAPHDIGAWREYDHAAYHKLSAAHPEYFGIQQWEPSSLMIFGLAKYELQNQLSCDIFAARLTGGELPPDLDGKPLRPLLEHGQIIGVYSVGSQNGRDDGGQLIPGIPSSYLINDVPYFFGPAATVPAANN